MVREGLRHSARAFPQSGGCPNERIRPRKNRRDLLCGRLDAAFEGRPDHPHRRDSTALVRQHRPARRRHSRLARSRFHPGLDRYPDALRHPSRLSPMPRGGERRRYARTVPEKHTNATGLWMQFPELFHQSAQGLLRRSRDAERTITATNGCRKSPATIPTFRSSTKCSTARWKGCS